jgi:hypothetical protein
MSYLVTAAVLVSSSGAPNPSIVAEIGKRMEQLLDLPPGRDDDHSHGFHEPRVFWSKTTYIEGVRVLRAEVCVDLDRLDDLVYKDSLVRDAKRAALDFLKNEEEDA